MQKIPAFDRRAVLKRFAALAAFGLPTAAARASELPECEVGPFSHGNWRVSAKLDKREEQGHFFVVLHPKSVKFTFREQKAQEISLNSSSLFYLTGPEIDAKEIVANWHNIRDVRRLGLNLETEPYAGYRFWTYRNEVVKGIKTELYVDGSLSGATNHEEFNKYNLKKNVRLSNSQKLILDFIDSRGVLGKINGSSVIASLEVNLSGYQEAFIAGKNREREIRHQFRTKLCKLGESPCILTTACCHVVGLADDCFELRTLRAYRDRYLKQTAEGHRLIERYYDICPKLLARLRRPGANMRFLRLYWTHIVPCVIAAKLGLNELALSRYKAMIHSLIQFARQQPYRTMAHPQRPV